MKKHIKRIDLLLTILLVLVMVSEQRIWARQETSLRVLASKSGFAAALQGLTPDHGVCALPPSSAWNEKDNRSGVRAQAQNAAVILRLRAMERKKPNAQIKDHTGNNVFSIPRARAMVREAMESGFTAYRLDETFPDAPSLMPTMVAAGAMDAVGNAVSLTEFDYSHWDFDPEPTVPVAKPSSKQDYWRESPDDWEEVQQVLGASLIDPSFIKSRDLAMVLRTAPTLSKEQAIELATLTRKRNGVARMILGQSMGRYIVTSAYRIANISGMPVDMLMKAGLTGALRAAELYDPKPGKDATFYGYARHWVENKFRAAEVEYRSEKLNIPMRLAHYVRPYMALKRKLGRHPEVEEMTANLRFDYTYLSKPNAEILSEAMRNGPRSAPKGKDNKILPEDSYKVTNIFVALTKTSEHVWHLEDPLVENMILRLSLATGISRKEWSMYMLYKGHVKTDKIRGLAGFKNIGALYRNTKAFAEQIVKKLQAYMNSHSDGIATAILMELAKTTSEMESHQEFFSGQVLEHDRMVQLLLHRLHDQTNAPAHYWEMYLLCHQLISAYEFRKEGLSIKTIGKAHGFSVKKTKAILDDLAKRLEKNPKAQMLVDAFTTREDKWEERTWREDNPAFQDLIAYLAVRTALSKISWSLFFSNEGLLETDSPAIGALAKRHKISAHRAAQDIQDVQRALRENPSLGKYIADRLIITHATTNELSTNITEMSTLAPTSIFFTQRTKSGTIISHLLRTKDNLLGWAIRQKNLWIRWIIHGYFRKYAGLIYDKDDPRLDDVKAQLGRSSGMLWIENNMISIYKAVQGGSHETMYYPGCGSDIVRPLLAYDLRHLVCVDQRDLSSVLEEELRALAITYTPLEIAGGKRYEFTLERKLRRVTLLIGDANTVDLGMYLDRGAVDIFHVFNPSGVGDAAQFDFQSYARISPNGFLCLSEKPLANVDSSSSALAAIFGLEEISIHPRYPYTISRSGVLYKKKSNLSEEDFKMAEAILSYYARVSGFFTHAITFKVSPPIGSDFSGHILNEFRDLLAHLPTNLRVRLIAAQVSPDQAVKIEAELFDFVMAGIKARPHVAKYLSPADTYRIADALLVARAAAKALAPSSRDADIQQQIRMLEAAA